MDLVLVAAAIAFFAGIAATCIGVWLQAMIEEKRRADERLIKLNQIAIDQTQRQVQRTGGWLLRRLGVDDEAFEQDDLPKANMALIGDMAIVAELRAITIELSARPPGSGFSEDDEKRLVIAMGRARAALATQDERVVRGEQPVELPDGAIDWSIEALAASIEEVHAAAKSS